MYVRFLRWAGDRINQNGIIAFVSNNSFLDAKSFDEFRKVVSKEFNEIFIVNLKGDARTSGKRRQREGGNVFSDKIRVGVAIYFLVKKKNSKGFRIHYNEIEDYKTAQDKQEYLVNNTVATLKFENIIPDNRNNWLNQPENSWNELIPVSSKEGKFSKSIKKEKVIFKLFSLGVATNRDDWIFDTNKNNLINKIKFFMKFYEKEKQRWNGSEKNIEINDFVDRSIKWTSELESHLLRGSTLKFSTDYISQSLYRPFIKKYLYYDKIIVHRTYQQGNIFPINEQKENIVITFSGKASSKPFATLATDKVFCLDLIEKTQCLPLYSYDELGNKQENVTDNGLNYFQSNYDDESITKY